MSENPDNKDYIGLGEQSKMVVNGEELSMDARFLLPIQHQLRFVCRDEHNETNEFIGRKTMLQQYQWSQELGEFDWFDIPCVSE